MLLGDPREVRVLDLVWPLFALVLAAVGLLGRLMLGEDADAESVIGSAAAGAAHAGNASSPADAEERSLRRFVSAQTQRSEEAT